MHRPTVIAAACIALSGAASAQTTAPTAPASTTAPAAAEKKICRDEDETGSTIPTRVCHTRAEWTAIEAANERANRANGTPWQGPYRAHSGPGSN